MDNRVILRHGNSLDYLIPQDGVRECRQRVELNTSSTLELDIRPDCPKYWYFDKPDMTAEAGGRVYCLLGDDCIETSRDAEGKPDAHVTLKELYYKLGKRHITAYNCEIKEESRYDHIDLHMVVLLGASKDPLYINGARASCPYAVGTAKYLLWILLQGTGWVLDTRFDSYWPGGTFDLESDKKTVLENIELVQGLFGGMLLWDSMGRRVALVDEEKYRPDNGFAVRYAFNQKGISRKVSRDIVNRVYPYGNSELNIAAKNGGKEYIEDYSYTTEVFEGIIKHSDIYNQDSLLAWARRELKKLCRPRYTYDVEFLDYSVPDAPQGLAGQAPVALAGMATIEDAEVVGGKALQRVIGLDRNVFKPLDCRITIGDVAGNWPTTLKDLVVAGDTVINNITNNNTINGGKVTGTTPALDQAVLDLTRYTDKTVQTTADGIYSHVSKTYETKTDAAHTYGVLSTTITQTAEEIRTEARHTYETKTAAATTKAELVTTITQTAEKIELKASATYETKTNASTQYKSLESSITVTASQIRSDVKATYETKTDAGTTKRSLESSITQTAGSIRTEVSREFTRVDGEISNANSRITQTASRVSVSLWDNGELKAQAVVSSINGGSFTINASKINLNGYVTVSSLKNGTTEIDGNCIKTGTIQSHHISGVFTDTFVMRCGHLYLQGRQVVQRGMYLSLA